MKLTCRSTPRSTLSFPTDCAGAEASRLYQVSAENQIDGDNLSILKPKIPSPTRALMKKRREVIENKTPRDHIAFVEICKTKKKKAREDIRKHNLDEIREIIEA